MMAFVFESTDDDATSDDTVTIIVFVDGPNVASSSTSAADLERLNAALASVKLAASDDADPDHIE